MIKYKTLELMFIIKKMNSKSILIRAETKMLFPEQDIELLRL
jgi:hypothetical protein